MSITWQPIGGGIVVATDDHCRFTEDAIVLARFAAPLPTDTVCDLGSGSGILPLFWCRREPPCAIVAVEREPAFFSLLKEAIDKNDLHDRIAAVCGDWADETLVEAGSMTLVTCNPPYFPFGKGRAPADDLRRAVRHEDDPAMLTVLCRAAARMLTENGRFCLCHRPERLPDVMAAMSEAGLTVRRLQGVQSTDKAPARLVLIEGAKHGSLKLLPPLVEHKTAKATAVYRKIYDR